MFVLNLVFFRAFRVDTGILVLQGPDWDKGLTIDILGLVARGRNDLSVMRLVSHTWKAGYEASVRGIWFRNQRGLPPPPIGSMAERFPRLSQVAMGHCPLPEAALEGLAGLPQLKTLDLGFWPGDEGWPDDPDLPIAYRLTDAGKS